MIRFHKVALAFEKEQHNMIRWGEMRKAGGDLENNSLTFFHQKKVENEKKKNVWKLLIFCDKWH